MGPAAKPLRLVFMGTPDLAATVLRRVLEWPGGEVAAVYCQPDRPAGRGMSLKAPPVKALALERGLPVRQPLSFKSAETVAELRSFAPDYLLVAAYGLILPQSVLDIPRRLPLNVHTSLLPRHRGAAPIQRAIMEGDAVSGATIMVMEAGLDTGPIALQEETPIGPADTAQDLHDVLAECGAKLLVKAIQGLEAGNLTLRPQEHEKASYAAKLEKSDGLLDFSGNVREIDCRTRGVTPWPGAFATLERGEEAPLVVGFLGGSPMPESEFAASPDLARLSPGAIGDRVVRGALAVRCADGAYLVRSLRPAGRKAMDAAAFMNGYLKGRGAARFVAPKG